MADEAEETAIAPVKVRDPTRCDRDEDRSQSRSRSPRPARGGFEQDNGKEKGACIQPQQSAVGYNV